MRKRILSLGLSLAMLLSLLPGTVWAVEPQPEIVGVAEIHVDNALSNVEVSLLANGSGPALAEGTHTEWVDRIDWTGHEYAKNFYTALETALEGDPSKNWLVNPTDGGNIVSKPFDSYKSLVMEDNTQVTYTYTVNSALYYKMPETTQDDIATASAYLSAAYAAFDRDHPEVFWLTGNSQCMKSSDGYVYFVLTEEGTKQKTAPTTGTDTPYTYDLRNTNDYTNVSDITLEITERDNNIGKIMNGTTSVEVDGAALTYQQNGTDYDKVRFFNAWLTHNNEYNTLVAGNASADATKSAWKCISALAGSTGENGPVCEGYARAMKVLCDKAGIPCVLVDGDASADNTAAGAHMWNYVQIGEAWYGVDTTWNDPTGGASGAVSSNERQDYLFVGSDTTNTYDKTFIDSHPVSNQVSTNGVAFTNGPELSDTALVQSISATAPTKTEYTVGENFDPTGMTLTATYWYTTTSDAQATDTISNDYATAGVTFEPASFDTAGEQQVTITYGGQTTTLTVTVSNVSSALTIDTLSNGTITATVDSSTVTSGSNVESGKTVTLTVTPDANYELVADSLKVTETSGSQTVEVTPGSDNTYTFTMPAYAVTVTAQFQQQTTAAPTFSKNEDTLTSADDKEAAFTLSSEPVNTTYKVYDAVTEGNVVSDVTAVANGSTLTLTFTTAPTTDTIYYISATESGKAESTRTPVTVKAYTKSTEATLSNLTISNGELSPAFASDTTEYTVEVPYSVASVTVIPTVTDSKASVTVNGESVTSGSASNDISLTEGSNTITVVVTAEDSTAKTYTITVTRAAAKYEISLDQNETYNFPGAVTGYGDQTPLTVTVTNTGDVETGELTVALSGTNADSFALTGTPISSIGTEAGSNTATFTVKPNTGLSKGTYTAAVTVSGSNGISASFDVSFTVAASQDEVDVNNAKTALESVGTSTWTMAQADAEAEDAIKTALVGKINGVISSAGITVSVDDIAVTDFTPAVEGTAEDHDGTDGSFGFIVTLKKADASMEVAISGCVITAKAYVPSSVATLDNLTLSEGTLNPTFSSSVHAYTAIVADTTDRITVTPTVTNDKASVTVNGKDASQPVSLTVGENTITVKVTAEDGTTQDYTVTVTRSKPAYGVTLDVPEFADVAEGYTAPGRITVTVTNVGSNPTGELTVTLENTTAATHPFTASVTKIDSIAADSSATFTIEYPGGLTAGTYTAAVKVSNENITSTGTVTLTVTPKVTTRTITFYPNGGSGSMSPVTVADGTNYTLPACGFAAPSGMRFKCWAYGSASGNQYSAGSTMTIGADVSFYAVWERIPSTGGGSSSGGSSSDDSSSSNNNTETTKNPDGSTTTTVTKPDGTVTTTTTDKNGNKTQTVEKPNGSTTTTVDKKDGSSSTTTVSASGTVEATVDLSESAVVSAASRGQAVALPMPEVTASSSWYDAPTVTVNLPVRGSTKVEIPVEDVTTGTVAILVKADGTEQVIKTSLVTDNGVAVTLGDGDTVKIVDNSKTFYDVSRYYWGADAIDFATSRQIFSGTSSNTFSPDMAMNRAMIVTVLAAYEGVDTTSSGAWYETSRQWAMKQGISDGTNMEQTLTREQLATMLWRYAGSPSAGSLSGYPDAGSVSSYAAQAMAWAVENGLISGMDGNLVPQGQATRAQVATILMRFVESQNA